MRILLTLVLLLFLAAAGAQTLTLDSCYEKARRNYPLIDQYGLIEKAAEFNLSNAGKANLPHLSLTGIGGYMINGLPSMAPGGGEGSQDKNQFIGIAQLNQTLWDGGATRAQKQVIRTEAGVDKAQIDVSMHQVRERVNQVYFGILLLNEQESLLEILIDNLSRNLSAVKLSNENGIAYTTDVDEVKVEILKAEQRLTEVNYVRNAYYTVLSMLTGETIPPSVTLVKPTAAIPDNLPVNRPELTLYQRQQDLASSRLAVVRAATLPKAGLMGLGLMIQPGIPFGAGKVNSLALAGVNLSWNTGMIYRSSNERQLNRVSISRINNQRATFIFNTNLELRQKRNEIDKHLAILEKDNEIVLLRSAVRKGYELKYANGMCSMNEVLTVTAGENEASANRALHEAQLLIAIYDYKTTSGN